MHKKNLHNFMFDAINMLLKYVDNEVHFYGLQKI